MSLLEKQRRQTELVKQFKRGEITKAEASKGVKKVRADFSRSFGRTKFRPITPNERLRQANLLKQIQAEAQRKAAIQREKNRIQSQKIQIETQKKIAKIQKAIRLRQRRKTSLQKSRLQIVQRRQIENLLKSQARKRVNLGLIDRAFVSTREGRIVIERKNGIKTKVIKPTKRKAIIRKQKVKRKPQIRGLEKSLRQLEREQKFLRKFIPTKSEIKAQSKRRINILIKAFDIVSAGSVTERRLNKREAKLTEDVEKFNKDFGGRELSEKDFNKAKALLE